MKKKIIAIILLITLTFGSIFTYYIISKDEDYSSTISFERAVDLIDYVKKESYEDDFIYWDIQDIEKELFLVSYSEEKVVDINKSKHSWIVQDKKVIYEIMDGDIVYGDDLGKEITSKFNHKVKTFSEDLEVEDIDFEEKKLTSSKVEKGKTVIYSRGEKGKKEITNEYFYEDGELIDTIVNEEVVKKPVDSVILTGTYVASPPPVAPPKKPVIDNSVKTKRKLKEYNVKFGPGGSITRWANKKYGDYTFTSSGCVPTSIAIALSGYNKTIEPDTVGDYLYGAGLYNATNIPGVGGKGVNAALSHYGMGYNGLTSAGAISSALQRGNVVLAAVQSGKYGIRSGTHMVVLNGYTNGRTYVVDPTYANKTGAYSVNQIWADRSFDTIDSSEGYVFWEVLGAGVTVDPEPPVTEPEPPVTEPDPKPGEVITLEEYKDTDFDVFVAMIEAYKRGFEAKITKTSELTTADPTLIGKRIISSETKGKKLSDISKIIEVEVIIYVAEPEKPGSGEDGGIENDTDGKNDNAGATALYWKYFNKFI